MNDIYTLPMDTFIAGQTREYVWELFKSDRTPFSTDGCTAYFSVCNYSDRNSCVWIVHETIDCDSHKSGR